MLTKQNEVLSNLASLDEEEAARAQAASSRWQVSPTYNIHPSLCCTSSVSVVCGTPRCVTLQCLPTLQKHLGNMTLTESEDPLQEAQEQASQLLVQQQHYQQVQQQLLGDLR